MNRGYAALCLLALVVSPLAAGTRDLRQQTGTFCQASTSVSVAISSGSGSARSNANCQAEADARNAIARVFEDWVDSVVDDADSSCVDAQANAIVEGVAEAVAKVFTTVRNTVDIQGTGTACADGFAEGDAFAVAMVDIMVTVALKTVKDKFGDDLYDKVDKSLKEENRATGQAVGEAASAVLSSAWAGAADNVCTDKGKQDGFSQSSAVQIKQAIAFLFAEVILTVCQEAGADLKNLKEWESSLADSTSFVDGSVKQVTIVDETEGTGLTGEGDPKECAGKKKTICCSKSVKAQDKCNCGIECEMVTVLDRSTSDIFPSDAKVWRDTATDDTCFCLASGN